MIEDRLKFYQKVIVAYGTRAQLNVAIEEMSELTKEICKFIRGAKNRDAIVEEMADVQIMLEQIQIMFGISTDEIYNAKNFKLERLKKRLENGE